jgi:hypothetical protein
MERVLCDGLNGDEVRQFIKDPTIGPDQVTELELWLERVNNRARPDVTIC